MVSPSKGLTERSKAIYEAGLRQSLESTHRDDYVAIEPDSGDYFLGRTLREARQAARERYPDRITFVIWIARRAVASIGGPRP